MAVVGAVTMVKDEQDIILYTLRHLRGEGVTSFFVANNLSTDGTDLEIQVFHDESMPAGNPADWKTHVWMADDVDPGYYQSKKMTNLFNFLRNSMSDPAEGPLDWIIPFDADELWYVEDGRTIAEYLDTIPSDVTCLEAKLHNYFGTDSDGNGHPFQRIQRRDPIPAVLPKVCVRAMDGVTIHQGNHGADGPNWVQQPSLLRVAHFPWRSAEQFERKARNGAAAYAATDLGEDAGAHWRQYGRILEEAGPEALRRDVYEKWFRNPPMDLEHHPAPFKGAVA